MAAMIALGAGLALTGCTSNPTGALSKLAHLDEGTLLMTGDVPPIVPGVDTELVDTSLRLLTEYDGFEFWVGATRDDQVCFIAEPLSKPATVAGADAASGGIAEDDLSATGSSAGTSTGEYDGTRAECRDAERFGAYGAYLDLPSGERAWLHTEYMSVPAGWTDISANVALRD